MRASGTYAGAQLALVAGGALLLPLWARYLSTEDYAVTGTLAAYAQVLSQFLLLGLHAAAGKHVISLAPTPGEQASYLSSVVAFQLALATTITAALALLAPLLPSDLAHGWAFQLALASTLCTSFGAIPLSVFQHEQRPSLHALAQVGTFVLVTLGNVVLVVSLRGGASGVLLSQLVAAAVTSAALLGLLARGRATLGLEWRHVRAALAFGLPLVPYGLLATVAVTADRMVLEQHASKDELGAYNFAMTLSGVFRVIVAGINQAWVPYYLALMAAPRPDTSRIIRVVSAYVAGFGALTLIGVLLGEPILARVFPERFGDAARYLPPLLLAHFVTCLGQFAVLPLAHFEATRWWPVIGLSSCGVAVALDLALVPTHGAAAAGWIFLAGQAVVLLVGYPIGRRHQALDYPLAWYAAVLALLVAACAVASFAPALLPLWARVVCALAVGAIGAWRAYREVSRRPAEATLAR